MSHIVWSRAFVAALAAAVLCVSSSSAEDAKPGDAAKAKSKISWKRFELDTKFRSEGVTYGDFNKDGKTDIAAGSVWFEAPDWKMHSILDKPQEFNPLNYSVSFCNYAEDVNGDGWLDLLVVDFPGKETWWFENPKETGKPWTKRECVKVTNNESPTFLDLDGDKKRELIMGTAPDQKDSDGAQRRMAFFKPTGDANAPWKMFNVSALGAPGTQKFSHGMGVGDINGDKRQDILSTDGWWEAPEDRTAGEWKFHKAQLGPQCAQMYVYDFNKDGLNDVVSSSAHDIGVWWHEQQKDGSFKRHEISRAFSQSHSLMFADMNGDGLPDLVTGKRWWAHGPKGDKDPDAPAVVVWFELGYEGDKPTWKMHEIDHASGIGTQFEVGDINGDGLLDVVTSNKKGTHYFQQVREK